jgi:hypothetical protein
MVNMIALSNEEYSNSLAYQVSNLGVNSVGAVCMGAASALFCKGAYDVLSSINYDPIINFWNQVREARNPED